MTLPTRVAYSSAVVVVVVAAAAAAAATAAASPLPSACDGTDMCCSLSGTFADGVCSCRAPWAGQNCSSLTLLPAQAFPQGYGVSPNLTSWGGNLILGPDGRAHLFVAEMVGGCGLSTWQTNSRCVHAVAPTLDGPFERADVAVDVWCHNPHVVAFDGGFALFQ